MILVFGGTTEGRKAVEVLEEAGTRYYYSTRSDGQLIELVNGIRLTGTMDVPTMMAFCHDHDIRLLVDAAHPFAEELHANLLQLAHHAGVPLVRYDRIYPPRTGNIVWCRDYQDAVSQLEAQGVSRLLALTGVNTISKLRDFWERHECWFRILNRSVSHSVARRSGFPDDHLVYYEEDDTSALIEQLRPQAVLTKESGLSGGFCEKVEAAAKAGVRVFAVERPAYPPCVPDGQSVRIELVDGPHGLRRAVEHLLPAFYPLHSGLTTGTCATAAAVAAALRLLKGVMPSEVPVILPDGETIRVAVGYADGYAYCKKESGDDPDVTDGLEVRASVEVADDFKMLGGEGVGTFTLPGFDYAPSEPAINKSPRRMVRQNLLAQTGSSGFAVTISVPHGAEVARRTFNPRLGIEGGISIIGVSGIVKPFSEKAFTDSIRKCIEVAKASGSDRLVLNSGAKSERFLRSLYPELPGQAFVQYGNYIGEALSMADELRFGQITLGVMLGKAVKLAEGQMDTHSKKGTMNLNYVGQMLSMAGCTVDLSGITLARELWDKIPPSQVNDFVRVVIGCCLEHCRPLAPHARLTLLLIADDGTVHSL